MSTNQNFVIICNVIYLAIKNVFNIIAEHQTTVIIFTILKYTDYFFV